MIKNIKIIAIFSFLIVIILIIIFVFLKPFSNNTKESLIIQFKKIEERYTQLLKRPLPIDKQDLDKRIIDSENLKNDEKILIAKAKQAKVFDNIIDTKEELLNKIDSKIAVLSDMVLSGFDINTSIQKDELQRAKLHIVELKEFRNKVEVANKKETISFLIKEYELTLMYKKVRLE